MDTQKGPGGVSDLFKGLLLTYFMPESCYDEFFLNFNFLDSKYLILVKYR